ncbi:MULTISPECIES: sensor histidine kinase [Actinomadura]|uniref:histidine kinase n=1 Tax=Actinomadura yumaensis TaxID=111807 RepID=A0ABW2CGK2_9ACTN|nr:sensor domain-containing protein [Actinomadura sp. J1-007]MWK35835.1 sensor histidine kinase [Actinomadura sp. J1-007]
MTSTDPRNPLESVARRRFLISSWPWRSAGYLLTTAGPALAAAVPFAVLALPWAAALSSRHGFGARTVFAALGALLVAGLGPLVALPLAGVERRRLRLVDTRPVTSGHVPASGAARWLRVRYGEAATWRELGYACLLLAAAPVLYGAFFMIALFVVGLAASPLLAGNGSGRAGEPLALGPVKIDSVAEALPYGAAGLVLLAALPYAAALLAGAHAALARALLGRGSGERLRAELVEVSRSRARLVDAFEAERRRIERDLHDGAQQRLVSLTLKLGLVRVELPPGSEAGRDVADAHEEAKLLMTELRELIRGIHPRVLTDRGLPAALAELADRSPVPVTVRADLPERLPPHEEGTAYFVAAEALANVAKHSRATRAALTAATRGRTLVLEVEDDGRGGADPGRGTGLTGLADRVAVIGGRMLLSSPAGGPTLLRVEIPCGRRSE